METKQIVLPLAIAIAIITSTTAVYISLARVDTGLDYQSGINAAADKSPSHIDAIFYALPLTDKALAPGNGASGFLVQNEFVYAEQHCEFCTHFLQNFEVLPQGSIAYVKPSKSYDIGNAKRLTFYAMGENGGEKIRIMVGAIDSSILDAVNVKINNSNTADSIASKFSVRTEYVLLTNNWKKYQIDISKISLNNDSVPFALQIARVDKESKSDFYIKDIAFDSKVATNPLN